MPNTYWPDMNYQQRYQPQQPAQRPSQTPFTNAMAQSAPADVYGGHQQGVHPDHYANVASQQAQYAPQQVQQQAPQQQQYAPNQQMPQGAEQPAEQHQWGHIPLYQNFPQAAMSELVGMWEENPQMLWTYHLRQLRPEDRARVGSMYNSIYADYTMQVSQGDPHLTFAEYLEGVDPKRLADQLRPSRGSSGESAAQKAAREHAEESRRRQRRAWALDDLRQYGRRRFTGTPRWLTW